MSSAMIQAPSKTKAAPGRVAALEKANCKRNCSPNPPEAQEEAGKALAVWLYNVGAQSLDATQATFDGRPAWRPA